MNRDADQSPPVDLLGIVTQLLRFCIVLGTVIFMAVAAVNTLSFLVSADSQKNGTFLLQATGKSGNFGANRSELILKAVIVDGRLLRWDAAASKSNWEVVDRGDLSPFLLYAATSNPASLTFQGKTFVAVLQSNNWPGVLRVKRNGTDTETLALRNPAGHQGWLVLESPASPTSPAIFVASVLLFAGCAYWFGPILAGRSSLPWLIFFLSVVHGLFWVGQCIGTTNDSPGYMETVSEFFTEGQPGYFPPGYPAFLGFVGNISGEKLGRWVTLLQHGMVVMGAVWIYLLLQRMMPEGVALLGGILNGVLAPNLTVAQTIMSEATTVFAMVGALYFTVRCAETGSLRFLLLGGVLAGWAGTLRVVPLAALLPSMCAIYLSRPTLRGLKLAVMTVAVTVGFVALPISWCWYKSGEAVLTDSLGLHLFNRVVYEQKQLDEQGPATRTLIARLRDKDPTAGYRWWDIQDLGRLEYRRAELLLGKVSWEGIRKDPWAFVAYTPYLAWKLLMADASGGVPYWGDTTQLYPNLESSLPLTFTASSLVWRLGLEEINRTLWPILCWLAVTGIFLGLFLPQRNVVLAVAWVPISYLLASASTESFGARYNVPIIPFVLTLGTISLAALFRLFESNRLVGHQPEAGAAELKSALIDPVKEAK